METTVTEGREGPQVTQTTVDVKTVPPLEHDEAMELAATEYDRLLAVVRQLDAGDWSRQTDNALWDVHAMLAHVLGTMDSNASPDEQGRQQAAAGAMAAYTGLYCVDALSEVLVRKHRDLSPSDLADALAATAPAALAGRTGVPAPVRETPLTPGPPFTGEWTIGYLVDVIYTRDTWMHRVDLCRATGQEMVTTPKHDGRIVADIVAEWARAHGQPFTLVLTGPAGGKFAQGDGGDDAHSSAPTDIELDAVEFCRILSGRGTGSGLLTTAVPF
jgi:uncharacterized protein (TIGR03083 family)